jgi:2-polyprenyl-3-methyl-5-hydroxy-6-metoxy-1,4-benzoquinol methylase
LWVILWYDFDITWLSLALWKKVVPRIINEADHTERKRSHNFSKIIISGHNFMVAQNATYLNRPLNSSHQISFQFLDEQFNSQDHFSCLDIGVGSGVIGKEIRQRFPLATIDGVDKFDIYLSSCREFYDECYCCPIEEFHNHKKYDVIFLLDVLEHLENPWQTILHLQKQCLKETGFAIVSIPNIAHWSTRLELLLGSFQYTEWGILDKTHLRFFTLKTYHELLHKGKLEPINTHYTYKSYGKSPLSRVPKILETWLTKAYPTLFALQFVSICRPIFPSR